METRIHIPENIRSFLFEIGDLSYFAARFFRELFTRPFEFKELMRQCYNMGNRSLLLVGVTGFILGLVFTALFLGIIVFLLWKLRKRMGIIMELYMSFTHRGHWYMMPLLAIMLAIGSLLIVAASSPFVAPFIYTLF